MTKRSKKPTIKSIKTIDLISKTAWSRLYGVSYTSAHCVINYGMPSECAVVAPIEGSLRGGQAAWYDFCKIMGFERYQHGGYQSAWSWCADNGVIFREIKHDDQKFSEVRRFGKAEYKHQLLQDWRK